VTVRKFVPENRLAKAFADRTGMLVAHAVQHANANLAQARPRHVAALNRKLDRLRELIGGEEEARDELYRTARDVGSDAGALGFAHMSQAALSLCDLLVSDAPEARMRASIAVHIDAVMALRAAAEEGAQAGSDAILRGLFSLSGRVP
jgi:hypothetical protein